MRSTCSSASASITCSTIGRPQRRCSGLGRADIIRVPSPAASTTAESGRFVTAPVYRVSPALQPHATHVTPVGGPGRGEVKPLLLLVGVGPTGAASDQSGRLPRSSWLGDEDSNPDSLDQNQMSCQLDDPRRGLQATYRDHEAVPPTGDLPVEIGAASDLDRQAADVVLLRQLASYAWLVPLE